jgi:ketosteroid isomerase-like protein
MELHGVVMRFVDAQNNFDSKAYLECFTDSAIVYDEGKTHIGKAEIRQWIEQANDEYQSSMKPTNYDQSGSNAVLTAEVSGTFPGSPIVLQFHLVLKDDLIGSLKITG